VCGFHAIGLSGEIHVRVLLTRHAVEGASETDGADGYDHSDQTVRKAGDRKARSPRGRSALALIDRIEDR
jgi:hypothetical protein